MFKCLNNLAFLVELCMLQRIPSNDNYETLETEVVGKFRFPSETSQCWSDSASLLSNTSA